MQSRKRDGRTRYNRQRGYRRVGGCQSDKYRRQETRGRDCDQPRRVPDLALNQKQWRTVEGQLRLCASGNNQNTKGYTSNLPSVDRGEESKHILQDAPTKWRGDRGGRRVETIELLCRQA